MITTRRYTNPRLPLPLPLPYQDQDEDMNFQTRGYKDSDALNWEPSNSSWNNFGTITKKELIMTLRNIELLSSSVSLSFTSRHFPAFLKCYKMGKSSKSKFALNSIIFWHLLGFSLAW